MIEPPSTPIRALFVDDDRDVAAAARAALERRGIACDWAASPEAAWTALGASRPDVILLDLNFARQETSGTVGLELLARLLLHDPALPVVVVTGHSGVAVAVAAMRGGAVDFLIKPWRNDKLVETTQRAALLGRARRATPAVAPADTPLLGESPAMVAVRALIARAAPTAASVLVHGPAGTGKTLVAHALHRASGVAGPLVAVEARDSPEPDALRAALAQTAGGTLLIEDLDLLPTPAQSALAAGLVCAPRLIATTRIALDTLRVAGAVRDDLLYAASTVEIALSPLAARPGDAGLLARHYLAVFAARHARPARALDPVAAAAVAAHPWPAGVRSLAAACERAVVLGDGDPHTLAHFALTPPDIPGQPQAAPLNLARSERAMVEAALKRHAHNISRAADELGITRATLYRRMARHGL